MITIAVAVLHGRPTSKFDTIFYMTSLNFAQKVTVLFLKQFDNNFKPLPL